MIYEHVGTSYFFLDQYAKAMELFKQTLAINEELGDNAGQEYALNGLANCYQKLGQFRGRGRARRPPRVGV